MARPFRRFEVPMGEGVIPDPTYGYVRGFF